MCLVLLVTSAPASAQSAGPSSWGVVGSFVPEWHVPSFLEAVAALHFSEDDISIEDQDLKGTEFRIGIARGRALSGDWGVSFVRRTFDDKTVSGINGSGCTGGGTGVVVLQCQDFESELTRNDVLLNGLEVHKFIPFVTISQRVQVGLNVGGGFGFMSGTVDAKEFQTSYTCTFPPGVFPDFGSDVDGPFSQCSNATISNVTTVQTGSSTDDVSRILKSDSDLMPIGHVEIAAAVIAGPRLKIRIAGGLNYPGVNAVSITGVYFFSGN
jgi:hypothetical protein